MVKFFRCELNTEQNLFSNIIWFLRELHNLVNSLPTKRTSKFENSEQSAQAIIVRSTCQCRGIHDSIESRLFAGPQCALY